MPFGKSPRNLILQALQPGVEDQIDVDEILISVLNGEYSTEAGNIPRRKKKKMTPCDKPKSSLEALLDFAGMSLTDYENLKLGDTCQMSLYEKFR